MTIKGTKIPIGHAQSFFFNTRFQFLINFFLIFSESENLTNLTNLKGKNRKIVYITKFGKKKTWSCCAIPIIEALMLYIKLKYYEWPLPSPQKKTT
jgi:hypothetical protein